MQCPCGEGSPKGWPGLLWGSLCFSSEFFLPALVKGDWVCAGASSPPAPVQGVAVGMMLRAPYGGGGGGFGDSQPLSSLRWVPGSGSGWDGVSGYTIAL